MKVIVSDSSVIIDLAKASLVEPALQLPYDFVIPDVMFADELLDLGRYKHEDLLEAGLRISVLGGNGVGLAFRYSSEFRHLTNNDCFALALAKTTDEATLLTGDAKLREAAASEDVHARGVLWLCDEMNHHGTVEVQALYDGLVVLDQDPLVRLPRDELHQRIRNLRSLLR